MSAKAADVFEVVHHRDPASKARPRLGKGKSFTPAATRSAEEDLGWEVRRAMHGQLPDAEATFGVRARFFTRSWQRRDVDNMLKLVLDACTGIVWADDAQVSEVQASVVRCDPNPRTELEVYETDAPRPPETECEGCGKRIRLYPSQAKRRFCSSECSGRARRRRTTFTCTGCGVTFERKVSERRAAEPFCSVACRSKHRKAESEKTVPCDNGCGNLVVRAQSQFRGALNFCSQPCRSQYYARPLPGRPRDIG